MSIVPLRTLNLQERLLGITSVIILQEHAYMMLTQKPNLHFIMGSNLCKAGLNEISTSYLETNLKLRPMAVTTDKKGKDTFFSVNTRAAAQITEGSQQQQERILVHLGMHDTPTTIAYCSLVHQNFPSSGFFCCCCWIFFFKQIWGGNENRKR